MKLNDSGASPLSYEQYLEHEQNDIIHFINAWLNLGKARLYFCTLI